MKRILIADDDAVTRRMLSRALAALREGVEVLNAADGRHATRIIENQPIDLVITDLQMPVVDGFELLSYLKNNYPDTAVIAITAFGTPEVRAKIESMGDVQYREKPLNVDELTETVLTLLDSDEKGKINAVSLPSFLQLVAREKKTCTLAVKNGDRRGKLHFDQGTLMAAASGQLINEDAVREMIGWTGASISVEKTTSGIARQIDTPLKTILREGLRQRDKQRSEPLTATRRMKARHQRRAFDRKTRSTLRVPETAGDASVRQRRDTSQGRTDLDTPLLKQSEGEIREPHVAAAVQHRRMAGRGDSGRESRGRSESAIPLRDVLRGNAGVLGFDIYDQDNQLTDRYRGDRFPAKHPPVSYYDYAAALRTLLDCGPLRYMAIGTRGHMRYYLFRYGEQKILVAMTHGFQSNDFIRRLTA